MEKPPYNFIAVEGNIGSGKTTLAKMLAKDLSAKIMLEQFEDNPFLPEFYQNKDRFAFHVELSFLAERYTHIKENFGSIDLFNESVVADYMFQKCLIFAQSTLKQGEFKLFEQLYAIIASILPKPDAIFYLYLPVKRSLENINKRGRPFERSISADYLQTIQDNYFNFFRQNNHHRIVIVDTSQIDFVASKKDYKRLKETLFADYPKGITRISL